MKFEIGSKSVTASIILLLSISLFSLNQSLSLAYITSLDPTIALSLGLFSIVLTELFFNYWRLFRKSENRFLIAKKDQTISDSDFVFSRTKKYVLAFGHNEKWVAKELPIFSIRFIYFSFFFCLCLLSINNRSLHLLSQVPDKARIFAHLYCEDIKAKQAKTIKKEEKVGCNLVKRAYELGYAKTLGDCGDEEVNPADLKICTNRRQGEPWPHFLYRKLQGLIAQSIYSLPQISFGQFRENLKIQYDNLSHLADYQHYSIAGSPRSSHHLFTNLKYEKSAFERLGEIFSKDDDCIKKNKARNLSSYFVGEKKKAPVLENITQNLLYNPKVKPSSGYCREFTIHWNSQPNTCDLLKIDPSLVFKEKGIDHEIQLVIERSKNLEKIRKIENTLNIGEEPRKPIKNLKWNKRKSKKGSGSTMNRFLSFNCYMETNDIIQAQNKQSDFKYRNYKLNYRELKIPVENKGFKYEVDLYKRISALLGDNFDYNRFNSQSNLEFSMEKEDLLEIYSKSDYALSKLEHLNGHDLFLDENWISGLMAVYPFHVDLKNYVELFRNEYNKDIDRL